MGRGPPRNDARRRFVLYQKGTPRNAQRRGHRPLRERRELGRELLRGLDDDGREARAHVVLGEAREDVLGLLRRELRAPRRRRRAHAEVVVRHDGRVAGRAPLAGRRRRRRHVDGRRARLGRGVLGADGRDVRGRAAEQRRRGAAGRRRRVADAVRRGRDGVLDRRDAGLGVVDARRRLALELLAPEPRRLLRVGARLRGRRVGGRARGVGLGPEARRRLAGRRRRLLRGGLGGAHRRRRDVERGVAHGLGRPHDRHVDDALADGDGPGLDALDGARRSRDRGALGALDRRARRRAGRARKAPAHEAHEAADGARRRAGGRARPLARPGLALGRLARVPLPLRDLLPLRRGERVRVLVDLIFTNEPLVEQGVRLAQAVELRREALHLRRERADDVDRLGELHGLRLVDLLASSEVAEIEV